LANSIEILSDPKTETLHALKGTTRSDFQELAMKYPLIQTSPKAKLKQRLNTVPRS